MVERDALAEPSGTQPSGRPAPGLLWTTVCSHRRLSSTDLCGHVCETRSGISLYNNLWQQGL